MVKVSDVTPAEGEGGSYFKEGYQVVKSESLVDSNMEIVDVEFRDTNRWGEVALFYLKDDRAFLTTSGVLRDQGKRFIEEIKSKGVTIEARLIRKASQSGPNRFLIFVDPQ